MRLDEILEPEDVVGELRAPDKRRLIEEIARLGAVSAGINASTIAEALFAREHLGSTGMGSGIAIPHARLPSLMHPVGLFARLRQPVDFDAIDGDRVDLVFLLLLPSQAHGKHLNALACVARKLRDERVRAALRKAREPDDLHAILTRDAEG